MENENKNIEGVDNPNDKLDTGLAIVSFCIPIVGAIIYFSNKEKMPNKAKSACHAALWGVGISLLGNILAAIAKGAAH